MSGGVLTLRHACERKLIIEETEGSAWETGVWSDLSDEALYEKIRDGVMRPYHDTREKRDCMAPRVTAYIPLLPASDKNLLGLPQGVGVEFIDLPGLKSIQDRDNIKVIQEKVHKAFSVVALDYLQVDDKHRKRLLEELKKVVEYLQGRTDSMIFILNRVDQRGAEDIPISERIEKLQKEIQEVLSLREPPEILPFSARLLYYAQCAWGSSSLNSASSTEQTTRLKLLQAMFQYCATAIKQHTSENKELRRWFRDIEDSIDDGSHIDDETMRKVLQYALDWSGGSKLWHRLRSRVEESFPELVLLPALIEVFDSYSALDAAINTVASIRKIEQEEEIEAQQTKINDSRQHLHETVELIHKKFLTKTETIIDALKKKDADARSSLDEEFKSKKAFKELFDAVKRVEEDLIIELIAPVRDAIKKNQGSYELEERLNKVVSPVIAKDIAKAYDLTSRKIDKFTNDSGHLKKSVLQNDKQGKKELDHAERSVRALFQAMREAMTTRAEFTLQAQAKKFETALAEWIQEQVEELNKLCIQELPLLKLDEAILADFNNRISSNLPKLPEKFFNIVSTIEQKSIPKKEKVGTTGSCFKKDVMENREYQELSLPDADTMARQWSDGIKKSEQEVWSILCNWITTELNKASSTFNKSIDEVINLAERALQEQLIIIKDSYENEMQRWSNIEAQKTLAAITCQQLKQKFC
jgi:hypothetical protein